MQVTISPSVVRGTITAPASKSAMQRACAAALLKEGSTILRNPGISNDDKVALKIIQQLGAKVHEFEEGSLEITGVDCIKPFDKVIDCGESGLSCRMFIPIIALSESRIKIVGSGSLVNRPMDFYSSVLPDLGVNISTSNGKLPIWVEGPLRPKNISIDGSLSSQFLTGLIFSYSAAFARDVTIEVKNLSSKPYIDLTLEVLADFGLQIPVNNNYKSFDFKGNYPSSWPLEYVVEGDWSGASFLLVAGAIAGDIVVKGLDIFSTQADKEILQALIQSEANMSIEEKQICVSKSKLKAFHFNATDCPDLFPPLVALAAYCNGSSVIEGVHRLTHKESNRALTLQEEFAKMGVEIVLQDNLMLIKGGGKIKGANVHSHHDHRIAMACAIAALGAEGDTIIEEAQAVNKSYPQFWEHLRSITNQ